MNPSWNITFGLFGILAGLAVGAPMARAFFEPAWLGGYGSLERRLLRLAHIAFIALGAWNIVVGMALEQGVMHASSETWICSSLVFGALMMPLLLLAAIRLRAALWVLPIPFLLVFGGTFGLALGRFAS